MFFLFLKLQASSITTSAVRSDIDSAAKYIGAGAATVGVAGAGMLFINLLFFINQNNLK